MQGIFAGRAALITGASSGFGRAIAVNLGSAGMEQWLVGRSAEELQQTAKMVADAGGAPTHCVPLDLQKRGAVADVIAQIGAAHGHLAAVVSNAGLMHPEPIMSGRMDRWQAMFEVNVLAPLEISRAAVELMRRQGKPANLIFVSSLAGRFDAGGVYGASKAALDMISRSLRKELEGDDIRVTNIVPGGFTTNLARSVEPESFEALKKFASSKGYTVAEMNTRKFFGDPAHIANTVRYVLEQPNEINLQEIIVRPPVSVEF